MNELKILCYDGKQFLLLLLENAKEKRKVGFGEKKQYNRTYTLVNLDDLCEGTYTEDELIDISQNIQIVGSKDLDYTEVTGKSRKFVIIEDNDFFKVAVS